MLRIFHLNGVIIFPCIHIASTLSWKLLKVLQLTTTVFWTKYLLKEYEYCQSGKNTHRNSNFEIEHFFPSAWADKNPHLLTGCGFNSPEQYKTNFIEQLGNKLILDSGLNRALKDEDVKIRTGAYKSQSYGRVNVSATNPSQSAINIGIDLDQKNCSHCRVYVQLRSLCLAIFAAKRF